MLKDLFDLIMTSKDSSTLCEETTYRAWSLYRDTGLRTEADGRASHRGECAQICTVVHQVGGKSHDETAADGHEFIAAMVRETTLGQRPESTIVEFPLEIRGDLRYPPSDSPGGRGSTGYNYIWIRNEGLEEAGQGVVAQARVSVEKNYELAPGSIEHFVESPGLPCPLGVAYQNDSVIFPLPSLHNSFCPICASARDDDDLGQLEARRNPLGHKRTEARSDSQGLVECAYADRNTQRRRITTTKWSPSRLKGNWPASLLSNRRIIPRTRFDLDKNRL